MTTAVKIAALSWTVLHVVGVVYLLALYRSTRYRFMLIFALSWSVMALWGVTIPGLSSVGVLANGVIIPPLASLLGLVALWSMARNV